MKPVSVMELEDMINDMRSAVKEKDGVIKRLVHLLAEKNDEITALQIALQEAYGDDEYIVFVPEWDTAH